MQHADNVGGRRVRAIWVALSLLVCLAPLRLAAADSAPSLAGHWEGAIEIPGSALAVLLDFTTKDDGTWEGAISIPAQAARNLPLTAIAPSGAEVTFEIRDVGGAPTFRGTFAADGATISGQFTQAGQIFPFSLARKAAPAAAAQSSLEGIGAILEAALKTFEVPGLAVAVVQDDKVVLLEGYGVRDADAKRPVTPRTLFAIGSSTKAFTTFLLGTLVDEGKLAWDKPVRTWIPWFGMYDRTVGETLTPRDLVTHRSGLPRHDLVWYNNFGATRKELVERLPFLEPSAELRSKWQYNNLMFETAGYLVEVVTGKSWEDAVRERVLVPLGMERTNFSVEASQLSDDFALPYDLREDKVVKIPFRPISNMGPAGSINSCAEDMSRWLRVQLGAGRLGDRRVIDANTLAEMHLAQMPTGATQDQPEILPADYGMGWFLDVYRGHRRVHHGGNIDGFAAMVTLFPQEGLGIVALANMNGSALPEIATRTLADRILGLPPIDWIGQAAAKRTAGKEVEKQGNAKKTSVRRPGTKPSHPLDEYAGDFEHPGYGKLHIAKRGAALEATYNGIVTPLDHWHYETWNGAKSHDPTFEDMKFTFVTDARGNVAAVSAPFEPAVREIVFAKKPDAKLSDPSYLARFPGVYELAGQLLTVALKGSALTLLVPGQPLYDLVPGLGGEFTLKQAAIVGIRFVTDGEGKVTALESVQPNGVFTAKRK